jgi:hypothetical protein
VVESFIILALAAALSAVVVWWAVNQPRTPSTGRENPPTARSAGSRDEPNAQPIPVTAPIPQQVASPSDELASDGFVMLPDEGPSVPDDRPSPALSIVRLVLTITFFAALAVAVLTVLGILVKTQLERYFTGL